MFDFSLTKRTGIIVSVILCVLSLALYGADFQIYGFKDNIVPGFALVTLVFSLVHYSRDPNARHTQDAETLGWQILFLALAAIYLARDVVPLNPKPVQTLLTLCVVLQILNYFRCKSRARAKANKGR